MTGMAYKLLEYDAKKDMIKGIKRSDYLKLVEVALNEYIDSDCCEEVYTDMPENIEDWFDESGKIIVRLKEGYSITDENYPWKLDELLTDICNEDGIRLLLRTAEVWRIAEEDNYRFGVDDDDMRRLK